MSLPKIIISEYILRFEIAKNISRPSFFERGEFVLATPETKSRDEKRTKPDPNSKSFTYYQIPEIVGISLKFSMEADAIISKAEGCNVVGLYRELRSYLEPLNGLLGFEGRKKTPESTVQIHGLAKRYVPFLGRLLKVSCNNLIQGISTSETEQKRADELFRTLKLVLDCFDALRPCLVGNPHEIEVQRHWMVRRLMAWKRFTEAREECWVTLYSLKVNIFCKDEKGKKEVLASARKGSVKKKGVTISSTRKKDVGVSVRKTKEKENENYGFDLYGELAQAADSGLVELVLGLVTDLIICTGESKLKEADEYRKILVLIEELVPWQR